MASRTYEHVLRMQGPWDFNNRSINSSRDFAVPSLENSTFTTSRLRLSRVPSRWVFIPLLDVPFWQGAHVNENKYFPCARRFYCLLDACLYKRNEWLLLSQLGLYIHSAHLYGEFTCRAGFIMMRSRFRCLVSKRERIASE